MQPLCLEQVKVSPVNHTEICDSPLTLQEIIDSISSLTHNKSPGVDGITSEFYRAFAEQLAPFFAGPRRDQPNT